MQKIKIKEIDNVLDLTKEYYEYYNSNPDSVKICSQFL